MKDRIGIYASLFSSAACPSSLDTCAMNSDVLRVLEFPAIRDMLAGLTSTGPGRELALRTGPHPCLEEARRALERTAEMVELQSRGFPAGLADAQDVREPLRRAAAGGGPLEGPSLHRIGKLCGVAERIKAALIERKSAAPALSELGATLPACSRLQKRIERCIDSAGKVRDDATEELARLRDRIRALRKRIESNLDSLAQNSAVSPHLQYPNPTLYHDRYVLAVNARERERVEGVVHGTSDSGATVYVEPLQIFETGNKLRETEGQEEEEVRSILWDLTREVGRRSSELLGAQKVLARLDLIRARARLAERYRMCRPRLGRQQTLTLSGARHPILLRLSEKAEEKKTSIDFDAVVPIDLHLGDDFRVMVVTGPNTGGKTVTLKTVGLLCVMARAGIFVPADRAIIPFYDDIYADIGDEQSLEQSLSTFSSHMSRIIEVLEEATEQSLVLLDELGAGTDPIEGSALGKAILDELVRRGCGAIVITHLGQLKSFATTCPEAENARVEFDAQTLQPTYHLSIGAAGQSNALEIAERLGLSPELLGAARAQLDEASDGEYGRLVDQVRRAKQDSEQRRRRARYLERKAEELKEEYTERLERIREEEERTGATVGLEMEEDLQELRKKANRLYEQMRHSHTRVGKELRDIRDGLDEVLERTRRLLEGREPEHPIRAGDEVYLARMHKWGEVLRVDESRGRATVAIGNKQVNVEVGELTPWGSHGAEA